jgi:hypothetical protein
MYRHARFSLLAVFAALAVVAGCDDGNANDSSDKSAGQQKTAEQGHQHEGGDHDHAHEGEGHDHEGGDHDHAHDENGDESGEKGGQKAEIVDVPKDGTKYDPSVKADQMPEGAWHCNMNSKVHYAAMNKGDGECPVCGMDLKEKGGK